MVDKTEWQAAQARRASNLMNIQQQLAGQDPEVPSRRSRRRQAGLPERRGAVAAAARPESFTQTNGGGDGWWMIMGSVLACAEGASHCRSHQRMDPVNRDCYGPRARVACTLDI